jgi:hypothetical protein
MSSGKRSADDLQFEQTDDPCQWVLPTGKPEAAGSIPVAHPL